MSRQKINIQEMVEELAENFVNEELANMISVSSRVGQSPHVFITNRYPGGVYSFITVNGDISVKFLRDHMPADIFRKLNNKHFDSFIRMVDIGVNKQFKWYLNEQTAA